MCERQQGRSECRGRLVGPRLFVERELEVRKPRQALGGTENTQTRNNRARGKRCNGKASKRRRAQAGQAGAGVDDLPGEAVSCSALSAASRDTDRSR